MSKSRIIAICALALTFWLNGWNSTSAQVLEGEYFLYFTDKDGSSGSLDNPEEYLSAASLERRRKQNIKLDSTDLPVSNSYIDSLKALGCSIKYSSKWFNGVFVYNIDSSLLESLRGQGFINQIVRIGILKKEFETVHTKLSRNETSEATSGPEPDDDYYGRSIEILRSLNGDYLHQLGFKGEDVHIAVLDAGFTRGATAIVYLNMIDSARLIFETDLVEMDEATDHHSHGTTVLMFMAANVEGEYIGTAPKAKYSLFRSEYAPTETLAEEFNWLIAAEKADSLGADIINSSLGYRSNFSDTAMNHAFADLDGNSVPITIAADLAAAKGILVVNSAGNNGAGGLNAPADGDSVFSIGATNILGEIAGFSSHGPTADARNKPDVVAWGAAVSLWSPSGFGQGNGTSYSSPIIAGLMACLREAFPTLPSSTLINAVKQSADNHLSPNNRYGHGTPDFKKAFEILSQIEAPIVPPAFTNQQLAFSVFYDGNSNICLRYKLTEDIDDLTYQLVDLSGRIVAQGMLDLKRGIGIKNLNELSANNEAVYLLSLKWEKGEQNLKLLSF